ncbi:MAG: YidC/Oxa1 family membrane protein insertase [Lachnospiraceae bacterium]|jgi:YidC/Oxa1 family membrane protein insertase|nr:YidC/Oxa1 family membrane protein insertase [Lachnospiraceae bacterium]
MLLTKNGGFLGPIATILGFIMDAIFEFCNLLTIPSIGLTIILFTIIIYMLLMPLTIKQQKFSKLSAKMNPEIQAIQKKYKGKQDQVSMMKMNEETKAVYGKYGVSPMGSCLQMIIQLPILFALYRVIWNIPAYVSGVKDVFMPLADKIHAIAGSQQYLADFASSNQVNFEKLGYTTNTIIDCLYKFKPENWSAMASDPSFSGISNLVTQTQQQVDHMNNFLGINIANSPFAMVKDAVSGDFQILALIAALSIPVLAGLTQWLNMKLMPTADTGNTPEAAGNMASTMKTMNNIMPLMSVFFCFTLPAGMGIYWIAGAVIRSIQQVMVNRHIDSMDLDALIEKNMEKQNKKREKMGLPPQKITNQAKSNVRNIQSPNASTQKKNVSEEDKQKQIQKSTEFYNQNAKAKPGSIASKARMVQQYNEKNKK